MFITPSGTFYYQIQMILEAKGCEMSVFVTLETYSFLLIYLMLYLILLHSFVLIYLWKSRNKTGTVEVNFPAIL